MSDTSPRLGLPYLQASQAQKHVTMNESLRQLDALVQLSLEALDQVTPPTAPGEGTLFAIGSGATGDWAGQDGLLAQRQGETWAFIAPQDGWRAWDRASGALHLFTQATGWQPEMPDLQNLDGVGIGTSSDPVNRLAVASDASIFTHAGASHRSTLNKAAAAEDASHNYQVNWSPRALCGLLGTEDYGVKVSPDGVTWHDGLTIDRQTGIVSAPNTPAFTAYGTGTWTEITTDHTDLTTFDSVFFDHGGDFDTTTGQFVVPVAGVYAFSVNGYLGGTTSARVSLGKNGTTLTSQIQSLSGGQPLSMTTLISLAAGDVITVRTANLTTLLRYHPGHTTFSAWKVA